MFRGGRLGRRTLERPLPLKKCFPRNCWAVPLLIPLLQNTAFHWSGNGAPWSSELFCLSGKWCRGAVGSHTNQSCKLRAPLSNEGVLSASRAAWHKWFKKLSPYPTIFTKCLFQTLFLSPQRLFIAHSM